MERFRGGRSRCAVYARRLLAALRRSRLGHRVTEDRIDFLQARYHY